jgi:hypothetical protein
VGMEFHVASEAEILTEAGAHAQIRHPVCAGERGGGGSPEYFRGMGGDQNRYETRSCSWGTLLLKRHDLLEESAVNDATWRRVA